MYLKSIEVQGFKSFANKINFQFHNGITGIVGPNGSGKSNVADAVRWVLGEQRIKQLRGASMQDVIFAGTENRKALSSAYVAITLENSDHQLAIEYDEVTIARRIYRSGESEYLINGTVCRLKDVNELFYDTGIGKEGYSIIGQGQIDKILSGKPEDRRELFDEAAGIVKFKRRKSAAEKKLEEEKMNLIRVNDVLAELEKQVKPLEKQSEVARVYLKKKDELKILDVNIFLLENERVKEQLDGVLTKHGIASDELEETNIQFEAIKKEYDEIELEIERLEASIDGARNSLTDGSVLKGKLEGEINVLKEQIHSAKGTYEHLSVRKIAVQKEIDVKDEEMHLVLEEKDTVDTQLEQVQTIRDDAKQILIGVEERIEMINNQIDEGKNTIIRELNERATIRSKMGRYDTMTEQVSFRRAELNSKLIRAKSNESTQEELIKELQKEFEGINTAIIEMQELQRTKEDKISQISIEISNKEEKLRDYQVSYHTEKSKLEAISNLTERYEGYGTSVKRIMEQKEQEKGLFGVVADIIQVEKKYETAIEIALGGNIQNIITADGITAKKMITFLKENKAGRATFLPLTEITNPQMLKNIEVLGEKGVIGLANTLVTTEKKYENVAKAMLGRIVVVDSFDNAMKITRKYDNGIRLVTLEGELFVPGGAVSGGAFKNNSNLLGRRREIEELEKKIKEFTIKIDQFTADIETAKVERKDIRMQLDELKQRAQEQFIMENTVRLNVIKAQERKNEAEKGFDELKEEEIDIDRQEREIRESKEKIIKELAISEELERNIGKTIIVFQKELEEVRLEETKQTLIVTANDVEVEKMRQKQEFQEQNKERISQDLFRFRSEMSDILQKMAENDEEVMVKKENIAEIEKTIYTSGTMQTDAEQILKNDIERKDMLNAKQKKFFTSREELAQKQTGLDKEVFRLTSQKEKLEESIENQIYYMWEEYEITLSAAAGLKTKIDMELPAMKRTISALKEEIRKLGDVNVNAIEDYKNLMERYTFLKTQHDDLVEAEVTLKEIIEELDIAMKKQFQEKFSEVCREFDKVFQELFGGGKGTLELLEEEDSLEAGIVIIAQPPGKKLQNMMQLSGGEKALTAIALLFAIQNMKPSPFCLLDEIEAALDENNVTRFAKYLHGLSNKTQFIVITHRRGTMEKADRLYGITMQEKGVSALVSVNLVDKELSD